MSDMLSQEEIEKLLGGGDSSDSTAQESDNAEVPADENALPEDWSLDSVPEPDQSILSEIEKDALGEIGNISMGSAATALHTLLSRKVDITVPTVSVTNYDILAKKYDMPYVVIHISYVEGLHGDNILIMKIDDVKAITSVMLGTDEYNDGDLSELHLSAISECMNQMMGASSTSLSKLTDMKVNISPPTVDIMNFAEAKVSDLLKTGEGDLVATSFMMDVEGLFETEIMLLMDLNFSKTLVKGFLQQQGLSETGEPLPSPEPPAAEPAAASSFVQNASPSYFDPDMPGGYGAPMGQPQQPPMGYGQQPPMGYGQQPPMGYAPQPQAYNVQPVQFESFDSPAGTANVSDNINMLMDVPLQVTVELGRTKKNLKDILDFNVGSIITLDKLVGEPVDVVVNGKMIAKGEVVIADDNFAVRITGIAKSRLGARV